MKKLILFLAMIALGLKANAQSAAVQDTCDEVYTVVQEMPGFPEGDLIKYLQKRLEVPPGFKGEGTVYLEFIVNKQGKVTNVRPVKEIPGCEECTSQVIVILQELPQCKPGKQAGQPVCVRYTVPVKYKVTSRKKKR